MKKEKSNIIKATILVLVLSLASKILGFVKSIIQASYFGATTYTDAFNVAYGFVENVLFMLITAISVAFVPLYIQNKKENSGKRFATVTITLTAIISIAFSIVLILLAPFVVKLLAPAFTVEQQAMTVQFFRVLLIGMVFALTSHMYTSLLNAEKIYGFSALGSVINSIILILFIVFLANELGVWVLAISVPVSYLIQWIILYLRGKRFASVSFKYGIWDKSVKVLLIQAFPILLGQATVEINQMIDRSLLSSVGEGIVTAVSYSAVLYQFVVTLVGAPLQTVLFTELSEAGANNDFERISNTLRKCYKLIFILCIPIAIVIVFGSTDIVRIVYGHGKFSLSAIDNCSIGLQMYGLCLLPVCVKKALSRAYYSQNNTKRPMVLGVFEVMLNVGLSIWWVKKWGIYGVVGATAVASFVFIIIMLIDYNIKYSHVISIVELRSYWRIVIGLIITNLGMLAFSQIQFGSSLLSFICKTLFSFVLFYVVLLITKEPIFMYMIKGTINTISRKLSGNRT